MSKNSLWPSKSITPDALLKRALEAAARAYSPYSRYRVGAAFLFADDRIIQACNVENASYSLTICAERSGIASMIAQGLRMPLAIAVVGSHESKDEYLTVPCPPCGACLQTLAEFNTEILVVLASDSGPKIFTLSELLPHSFTFKP